MPVVFNGANMSTVAPPHSYINVADFPTIEKLVAYLSRWGNWSHLVKSFFCKGLPQTTPFLRATSGGGVSTKLSTTMRPCRPNTGTFFLHTMLFLNFLYSGADYVICCGHERINVARVLCQILMIGGFSPYFQGNALFSSKKSTFTRWVLQANCSTLKIHLPYRSSNHSFHVGDGKTSGKHL